MKLHKIAFILLVIGGLNYLLDLLGVGLSHFVSGGLLTVLYVLMGLAAIYEIATHGRNCRHCNM